MKFLNKMANWLLQKSDLIQKQSDSLPLAIPGGAMQFGLGDRSNDEELLKSYHTWVFRAIRIIAENVAKQKTFLFLNRNNERERIDQHPFLDLLKEVNPIMTKYDLWELTMTYLELTGNAYWLKVRNRLGVVSELWPVRPDLIKPVPDKQEILKGYIWQFRGKKIAYERNDIIHIKYPNPLSIYTGMGTLKAAAFVYDSDLFMRRWHINTFKNQARPDGVLETDEYLGSEDMQRMRVEWQKVYGSEKNTHKMAILQAGIKYKQLSLTPQELDWLLSIKASKIDIFEMFGVPRAIAGIIEDVNRANAEAAEVGFAKNTIHPKLCKIAEKINQDLIPEFDENLEFEFENPVPEDKEFKLKERESNLKNFITDVNEERSAQGLEPADWGQGPWMPFNLVQFNGSSDAADRALKRKSKNANGTFAVLFNEDFRLAAWKRFDEVARTQRLIFQRGLRQLFKEQRKAVLSNLSKIRKLGLKADQTTVDFILFDPDEWVKKFSDGMDARFKGMVLAGAKKGIDDIAAGTDFDLNSPLVRDFLDKKKFKFSFHVNDETEKSLRRSIIQGLDSNETIDDLTRRVQDIFHFSDTVRAPRIAVTEATTSTNFGILDAYRQSGIVEKKNWLSQRDADVRESHAIDDEIVKTTEVFSNGLAYPGDPGGDASEIINCRCTTLPVIEN